HKTRHKRDDANDKRRDSETLGPRGSGQTRVLRCGHVLLSRGCALLRRILKLRCCWLSRWWLRRADGRPHGLLVLLLRRGWCALRLGGLLVRLLVRRLLGRRLIRLLVGLVLRSLGCCRGCWLLRGRRLLGFRGRSLV